MGVAASGATLEIQLVADVARLQRDMKDMQTIVKGATSSASRSFDDFAKGSVAAATAHAASAQTIARSAVTGAAGVRSLGMAASNSNIAMLEMVHITRSVAAQLAAGASPLRAFSMELGRISTAVQYSSGGITGLIKQFAQMIGIISVTGDAELSAAAATAAASATSIKAVADRTASVLAAREAQVALAKVELGAVVGTDLEAAAQAKLVKAMRAAEVQSGKAVIASEALAAANAEAAASGGLAAAAMRTAFTPLGGILLGIGAAVGIALAAFVLFHDRARAKIDALIDKMREHYQKTLEQAEADRIWAQSLEGVAEAMGKVADQIEKTFTTEALTKTRELADAQRKLTDLLRQQKEAADALAAAQRANLTPQVGIGQGAGSFGDPAAQARIEAAQKKVNDLKRAIAETQRAIRDLQIAGAAAQGEAMGDVSRAAESRVKDMEVQLQARATSIDGIGKAIKGSISDEVAALEKLRLAFGDAASAGSAMDGKSASARSEVEHLVDQLTHGVVASDKFTASVLRIADALKEAAKAAKVDPIEQFKKAVFGAEGTGPNQMGSSAAGFGQFMPGTWLSYFNRLFPDKADLSEAAKLAYRNVRDVATAVIDKATDDYVAVIKRAGKDLTAANLYAVHLLGAGGASRLFAAAPGTPMSDLFGQDVLTKNPFLNGTVATALAAIAKRIGDSSGAVSAATATMGHMLEEAAKKAEELRLKILDLWRAEQELPSDLTKADVLTRIESPDLKDILPDLPDYGKQVLDSLKAISDQAQATGEVLADAFGKAGSVIGDLVQNLAKYTESQEQLSQEVAAGTKTQATAEAELAALRTHTIASTITGLKSLFKEHSAGYKVMEAIEKAYAIAQLVRTIASIAPKIAAGAATMFSQLGVFAFPAVAAMIALMASLGFGRGGGSSVAPTSAEDLQKAAGTGTVLGDSAAKSDSIQHSLDLMAKNSTKGLDYSSDMVRSLRKIESGIGDLTAAIAKELQVGGAFDTSGLGLGTSTKNGFSFLGAALGGLLGGILGGKKTVTTSVYDQGIQFNPTTLAAAITDGISGSLYTIIQKVTKTSGFLGIGGGTKTSYSTTTTPLDQDLQRQIGLILGSLRDSVVEAAKVLGLDVGAALDAFQVEIGKISFKDLTGQQITDELNAVFSKIGDQMAGFAVAGLEQYQKAGEGLFETLMRLAKDYLTIDAALKSIGMTFGSVGTASIAARESLIDLAGGLDAFVSQVSFFYDHFLTSAQKVAFEQQQVDAAFAAMGVAAPTTIAGFTQLVQGLDLSTDAGQAMFEQLMQIAPAFYDIATAAQQLAQKQAELQVQLLQAQGNDAAATALQRQMQLDALAAAGADQSLIDLQKAVWAAQDAAAAAAAALALSNKQTELRIQILQAQGKAEEALALQRKLELSQITDPTLIALTKQLYAAQDAAAAQAKHDQAVADAKNNLTEAYKRESQALQDTADKFHKFADDLKTFRDSLFSTSSGPGSYNQALIALMKQSGLATGGDETALGGGLQDAARTFLDVATANAHSLADVARARALVARQLDQAIGGAQAKATIAEQQLTQMKDQVGKLIDIDDHVLSVVEAIQALNALLAPAAPPPSGGGGGGGHDRPPRPPRDREDHDRHVRDRLDEMSAAMMSNASALGKLRSIFTRADRGSGIAIVTDADAPIQVAP
jgi:hypothetical protein